MTANAVIRCPGPQCLDGRRTCSCKPAGPEVRPRQRIHRKDVRSVARSLLGKDDRVVDLPTTLREHPGELRRLRLFHRPPFALEGFGLRIHGFGTARIAGVREQVADGRGSSGVAPSVIKAR